MGQLGGSNLGGEGIEEGTGIGAGGVEQGAGGFVFQDIERIVAVANSVYDGDKRMMYSDDGGDNWTAILAASSEFHQGIGYSLLNRTFMLCGGNGLIATSQDAIEWTVQTTPDSSTFWVSVAFSPTLGGSQGRWVATASSGSQRVMTSDDNGASWTLRDAADNAEAWNGCVWHETDEKFFAGAQLDAETIMSSTDGITWLAGTTVVNSASLFPAVDQPSGRVIYMGAGSRINYIDNTESATPTTQQTTGDGGFIGAKNAPAVNADGSIWMGAQSDSVYTSADGTTGWAISSPASGGFMKLARWSVDFSQFVGLTPNDDPKISSDADQWTSSTTIPTGADNEGWQDMVVGRR